MWEEVGRGYPAAAPRFGPVSPILLRTVVFCVRATVTAGLVLLRRGMPVLMGGIVMSVSMTLIRSRIVRKEMTLGGLLRLGLGGTGAGHLMSPFRKGGCSGPS